MLPLAVRMIRTRSLLRIIWCRFMAWRFRLIFLIRQSGINRGSLTIQTAFQLAFLIPGRTIRNWRAGIVESDFRPLYSILTNG